MSATVPFPPPPWRQYLHSLPESDPPAALADRVAQARREARRRHRRPVWAALAAVLVLGVAAALLVRPAARAPSTAAVATPETGVGAPAVTAVAADPGLRRLDDEIALAYARGAGDAEVAVLWQARERVLASLEGPAPVVLARL